MGKKESKNKRRLQREKIIKTEGSIGHRGGKYLKRVIGQENVIDNIRAKQKHKKKNEGNAKGHNCIKKMEKRWKK